LLGVGLPSLTSFTLAARFGRYVGAGFTYGVIPTVKITYYGDAALSYHEFEGNLSLYPFGGAFFLGSGLGYASAQGTLSQKFDLSAYAPLVAGLPKSLEYTSEASASAVVLTPRIGFLQRFGSGFTIGGDVGAQVPVSSTDVNFQSHLPAGVPSEVKRTYVDPNDAKVESTIRKAARTPVPTFGVRIGWMF
jgi:hypothetical protein